MDLFQLRDIFHRLALMEQAFVDDLAAARVQAAIKNEKDFKEACAGYDQFVLAAKEKIDAAPDRRNPAINLSYLLYMYMSFDANWLSTLQDLLADRILKGERNELSGRQRETLDTLRAIVESARSTNGDSLTRVPRSFERGIFSLMQKMDAWHYSPAQTDVRLGELVEVGWLRRTKGANNSAIFHATKRFAQVVQSVLDADLPPPVELICPRSATYDAKISLPRLGWEL